MLPAKSNTLEKYSIPPKWQPQYYLKRIGEEDIAISQETRDGILKDLANNGKFVQIGEYTIMLNSIKGIDPRWGAKNIPPRPKPRFELGGAKVDYQMSDDPAVNQEEIDEWDKCFGGKQ